MLSIKKMQTLMSFILLTGTLLATALVMIGGILYLLQSGNDSIQNEWLPVHTSSLSIKQIWQFAFSFSPLGIIELGLLLLVATQTIRVALLCWFYTMIHDYKFVMISAFILILLIYSSFWRENIT
jgi:uncharacterized membrane protein